MNESHEDRRDRSGQGEEGRTEQRWVHADRVDWGRPAPGGEDADAGEPAEVSLEMHELALLRAGVPQADTLVLARVRLALGTAITQQSGAAAPVDEAPAPRPGVRRGAGRGHAVRTRRRIAIRAGTAAGVAAAIAAGFVLTDLVTRDGRPVVGSSATATAQLTLAADATLNGKDPVVGPGQYLYLRKDEVAISSVDQFAVLVGRSDETWVPADTSATWMERRVDNTRTIYFHKGDKKTARKWDLVVDPEQTIRRAPGGKWLWCTPDGGVTETPQPRGSVPCNGLGDSWQTPSPEFMATLSRDPHALLSRIYHDSKGRGEGRDAEAFVYIADILRAGTVPADLRAALYRAAALIPGVTSVGDSINLDGQHGVAVGVERHGVRRELVFDPDTGAYIGRRDILVDRGKAKDYVPTSVPEGATIESSSVHRAVVDTLGATH